MNRFLVHRFEKSFNNTKVNLYSLKGNDFVFINSMAMQNDRCELCESTKKELHKVSKFLKCQKNPEVCLNSTVAEKQTNYNRPIVLQHFPTYRRSDNECLTKDTPIVEEFRENWEVLSKKSTDLIGK